jgi:photosystem II stability/assembly factor-like uncharacterized protein
MPLFARYFLAIVGIALLITALTFFIWRPTANAPTQPKNNTAQVTDAGVLMSQDGGASWKPLAGSGGLIPLVLAEKKGANHGLYIGTKGQGLWFLKDGASALEQVKDPSGVLDPASSVYSIAQTHDGIILYLGVLQKNRGYIIRIDENKAEAVYQAAIKGYGVLGVIVDQSNSAHINAAVSDGTFIETRDGGSSQYWSIIAQTRQSLVKFAFNPKNPNTFWAFGNKNAFYSSDTAGQRWTERLTTQIEKTKISTVNNLQYIPTRDALFAATNYGLIDSVDNGKTWRAFRTPVPPLTLAATALAAHPSFEEVFWFAAGNQIYRTDDGGESWRNTVLPTEKKVSVLQINTANPKILYAGITQ